jgi:hypothetical protein
LLFLYYNNGLLWLFPDSVDVETVKKNAL